jgi:hypothetical protein
LYEDTLTKDNLLAALAGTSILYSYNGKEFDLPFIAAKLGVDLAEAFSHCDLMEQCWRRNLYGGQKKVEKGRPGTLPQFLVGSVSRD